MRPVRRPRLIVELGVAVVVLLVAELGCARIHARIRVVAIHSAATQVEVRVPVSVLWRQDRGRTLMGRFRARILNAARVAVAGRVERSCALARLALLGSVAPKAVVAIQVLRARRAALEPAIGGVGSAVE